MIDGKFTSNGITLVIGSPATAQDGQYQALVQDLQQVHKFVEKQMLDRILDGATTLQPNSYSTIHVTLGADNKALEPKLKEFTNQAFAALIPGSMFQLHDGSGLPGLTDVLQGAGFVMQESPSSSTLAAKKPDQAATSTGTIAAAISVPLRKRPVDSEQKTSKKALWTLVSPTAPIIDSDTLLTAADLVRPTCEPANSGTPRRKKACKNCSCGLAEIEAEEARLGKVVLLDGSEGGGTTEVTLDEKERLATAAKMASKATSSCGSCYLGDAFRCASCPYLGLPAFKPGEKVQIDLGMDDI